jgi:uncharacterized protein YgiM (DUF1202 family)
MNGIRLEPKQAIALVVSGLVAFVILVTAVVYLGDALHFMADKAAQTKSIVEARVLPPSPTPWPTETATPSPTMTATPRPVVVVEVEALNVRKGPGADSPRIGKVHEGDRLIVLGRKKDARGRRWLRIRLADGELTGWVAGWYTRQD